MQRLRDVSADTGADRFDQGRLGGGSRESTLRESAALLEGLAGTLSAAADIVRDYAPLDEGTFYENVERFEMQLIRRALGRTRNNQRQAAGLLGLKVSTLNSKVKRYKLL